MKQAEIRSRFDVMIVDRDGKTAQRSVPLVPAQSGGKHLYARVRIEVTTPHATVLTSVDRVAEGAAGDNTTEAADSTEKLLTQRLELARQTETLCQARYRAGLATQEELEQATIAVYRIDLQRKQSQAERIALTQQWVNAAQEIQKLAEERFKAGLATHIETIRAESALLDAEIALQREKSGGTTQPPFIVVSELNPRLEGKKVSMAFEIEKIYRPDGIVPVEQFAPFGIRPVLAKGSPSFSILVSGDLARPENRVKILGRIQNGGRGTRIQAAGTITVFPAPENASDRRPSYQLTIRDTKRFRVLSVHGQTGR